MTVEFTPQSVAVEIDPSSMGIALNNLIARDYEQRPAYDGSYEITPTAERQTLDTKNKRMTDNVVIEPIPSNYGLITWNGAYLTVS